MRNVSSCAPICRQCLWRWAIWSRCFPAPCLFVAFWASVFPLVMRFILRPPLDPFAAPNLTESTWDFSETFGPFFVVVRCCTQFSSHPCLFLIGLSYHVARFHFSWKPHNKIPSPVFWHRVLTALFSLQIKCSLVSVGSLVLHSAVYIKPWSRSSLRPCAAFQN